MSWMKKGIGQTMLKQCHLAWPAAAEAEGHIGQLDSQVACSFAKLLLRTRWKKEFYNLHRDCATRSKHKVEPHNRRHDNCAHESNQPGEYKRENLDKGEENSTANVGEEERKDVSSQSPPQHRHATVHIDCSLGMEILKLFGCLMAVT